MKLQEITDYLESIAPLALQEDYDNAGLIIGDPEMEITGAICTLDSTEDVLEEARALNCNLIVAHHPIIFSGIKKFTDYYVHRVIRKALLHDLAIYAIHTNLDNVLTNGVNERIAQILGLEHVQILKPKNDEGNIGSGVIGHLTKPIRPQEFLDHVKNRMECGAIRHTRPLEGSIRKVACCGGSGSFLLQEAIRAEADVFITSDFKYHEFFDADGRILVMDIGHYESEHFTSHLLAELISNKFPNFAAHYSKVNTNPVFYYQ